MELTVNQKESLLPLVEAVFERDETFYSSSDQNKDCTQLEKGLLQENPIPIRGRLQVSF